MVVDWKPFDDTKVSARRRKSKRATYRPAVPVSLIGFFQKSPTAAIFELHEPSLDTSVAFASTSSVRFVTYTLVKLAQFRSLPADWDSYGARPISSDAISMAKSLLQALDLEFSSLVGERVIPFDIAPIPTGGVQLEWRSSNRALEVEVSPDGDVRYLVVDDRGPVRIYTQTSGVSPIQVAARVGEVLSS